MNANKLLLGLLAGAAIGITAGILFAPKKGAVTRKLISKKGKKLSEGIEENVKGLVSGIKTKIEDEVTRISKLGKNKVEQIENEFKSITN